MILGGAELGDILIPVYLFFRSIRLVRRFCINVVSEVVTGFSSPLRLLFRFEVGNLVEKTPR